MISFRSLARQSGPCTELSPQWGRVGRSGSWMSLYRSLAMLGLAPQVQSPCLPSVREPPPTGEAPSANELPTGPCQHRDRYRLDRVIRITDDRQHLNYASELDIVFKMEERWLRARPSARC